MALAPCRTEHSGDKGSGSDKSMTRAEVKTASKKRRRRLDILARLSQEYGLDGWRD